jgi:threonylcarbamoyladenosine tRNA methylthiotransferase MtaB
MTTFSINTLGCKVNQYESQQVRELLEQLGLRKSESPGKSDLIIINTCCVTHVASAKSRQYIHKAQKYNPNATIIVSGCLPTVDIGELSAPAKNVHLITNRSDLAATLSRIASLESQSPQFCPDSTIKAKNSLEIKHKNASASDSKLPNLTRFAGHTRAFLKVQDGCDGHCLYCIVPKTRPVVRSKSADAVLQEAQALVRAGHKEIVVTGVFLGAYGQHTVRRRNWLNQRNDQLADLLDSMAQIPGLCRIRLSSLEPADITPRLLETFHNHNNIMPHLHLSLQSGSNRILKKMCRQYNADEFRETIALIKSQLDRPALTTDIIVGFPGESDDDFEQTVGLAKDVGFAKMHVFSFSPRKGTAAANLAEKVDTKVIKSRSEMLHKLGTELGKQYRRQFIGQTAEILLENNNGQLYGRSERYFKVFIEKPHKHIQTNQIRTARLTANNHTGMTASII